MKTVFPSRLTYSPFLVAGQKEVQQDKVIKKNLLKSDLRNHRFAIIENKVVQDPINWDEAWFGNYE